jgi:hypothetical protein
MYDHDLLKECFNEPEPIICRLLKWIAGLAFAFTLLLFFSFLFLRAIEIESNYSYQWDEELQTYHRVESGV